MGWLDGTIEGFYFFGREIFFRILFLENLRFWHVFDDFQFSHHSEEGSQNLPETKDQKTFEKN